MILDLTGERSEVAHFDEGQILFGLPVLLSRNLLVPVFGVTILADTLKKSFPGIAGEIDCNISDDDLYLAGPGLLSLEGVQGGSVRISLYELADGRATFLRDRDGGYCTIERSWGSHTSDHPCYEGNPVSVWPFGSGEFQIYAAGPATLSFSTRDLVPASEFLKNTNLGREKWQAFVNSVMSAGDLSGLTDFR